MKIKLFFTFSFFTLLQQVHGQDVKVLELDFLQKNFVCSTLIDSCYCNGKEITKDVRDTKCSYSSDFKKHLDDLKEGDFYKIKITNINTFRYNISVTGRDTILERKIEDFPSFSGFSLDNIQGLLSNIPGLDVINSIDTPGELTTDTTLKKVIILPKNLPTPHSGSINPEIIRDTIEKVNVFLLDINKTLKDWTDLVDNFVYTDKALSFDIDQFYNKKPNMAELEEKVKKRQKEYEEFQKKYKLIINRVNVLKDQNEKLLEAFKKTLADIAKLKPEEYTKQLAAKIVKKRIDFERDTRLEYLNGSMNMIKGMIDKLGVYVEEQYAGLYFETNCVIALNCEEAKNKIIDDRNAIIQKIESTSTEYKKWRQDYVREMKKFMDKKVLEGNTELTNADAKIIETYDAISKSLDEASKAVGPKEVGKMLKALSEVVNHSSFTYTSLPMQVKGDQAIIKIAIVPRDSGSTLQAYHAEYAFPRYKKYFIGTGASFYLSWLHDDAYSVTDTNTIVGADPDHILVKENDKGNFETGSLLTFNLGFGLDERKLHSLGLFVGPGISFTKTIKPRLALGANYAFGKRNKFTFGIGGIIGYSERLSKAFDDNEVYKTKPTDYMVSKFSGNFVMQVGYIHNF